MEVEFELSVYGLLMYGPRGQKELLPGEYTRSSNTHEGIKFSSAASTMKREEMQDKSQESTFTRGPRDQTRKLRSNR